MVKKFVVIFKLFEETPLGTLNKCNKMLREVGRKEFIILIII